MLSQVLAILGGSNLAPRETFFVVWFYRIASPANRAILFVDPQVSVPLRPLLGSFDPLAIAQRDEIQN